MCKCVSVDTTKESLNKVPCITLTFNFILPSILLLFSLYFLPLLSSRCLQCRTVNFLSQHFFSFLFNTTFKWITCPFVYCPILLQIANRLSLDDSEPYESHIIFTGMFSTSVFYICDWNAIT